MTEDTNLLQSGVAEPMPSATGKPEGMPDKFWDAETGQVRIEALLKSYLELEKKMSSPSPSSDEFDEETRARFLRASGVPETPEGYTIAVRDNLFDPDPELNKRLHDKGFSCDQAQEVYDLAVEQMVPMILDMASQFQAEKEINRLIEFFGGNDQWAEASRQMLAFGKRNLPPQVLQGMSASYEGIMALYKMMQSEEPQTLGATGRAISSNAEKDLQSMMNDPKYWRDKDPAYIAKVTQGFQNLYAE